MAEAGIFRAVQAAEDKTEVTAAQGRWKLEIKREVDKLPPHKRPAASKALDKVLHRFYDQKEENIRAVIGMVFELLNEVNIRA